MVISKAKRTIAEQYAYNLRNRMTQSELQFKNLLQGTGIRFKSQKIIYTKTNFFIIDFYIPSKRLCIEVDGGYHTTKEQMLKDKKRDSFLVKNGYSIIRFSNKDVNGVSSIDLENIISRYVDARTKVREIAPSEEKVWRKSVKMNVKPCKKGKKKVKKAKLQHPSLDKAITKKKDREQRQAQYR